uniref:lycopene beta-cyclase n=1 Tax=Paulinella micropora TaxID=1928728 RepID=A0A385I1D2_9EUKA|nr:lycopene cyclase [Paulinella micropora]AXY63684.1 lycopene cyclase [Paulinella micropora]
MNVPTDVLVIGAGPAALAISSELCKRGVTVQGLASTDPTRPWNNTYGIWGFEVDKLRLSHLLSHRWSNCNSHFRIPATKHRADYGLFDKPLLQSHWLSLIDSANMVWHQGTAVSLEHFENYSSVNTKEGFHLSARLIIEATGHQSRFISRPISKNIAYQTAYGMVGRFSKSPINPGQFTLMDYYNSGSRFDSDDNYPPTFLYAMDFGEDIYFLEETSLAFTNPVTYDILQRKLQTKLNRKEISILEVYHEEFCAFPMNLPLPYLNQQVVGFGAAASMVHPASGYTIGNILRSAPLLAQSISDNLMKSNCSSSQLACEAWTTLWSQNSIQCHRIFQFGLEKLMRFSEPQLLDFFDTFFSLPLPQWSGFLTNTLTIGQLSGAMINLFLKAPWSVRKGLMEFRGQETELMLKILLNSMK